MYVFVSINTPLRCAICGKEVEKDWIVPLSKELPAQSEKVKVLESYSLEEADFVCFAHFNDFKLPVQLDRLSWKTAISHMDTVQQLTRPMRAKRVKFVQYNDQEEVCPGGPSIGTLT